MPLLFLTFCFVDDSLILMKANVENATSLKRALNEYCLASGQLVSEAKSSVFLDHVVLLRQGHKYVLF